MTGLWVALAALVVVAVFGVYRKITDGRARAAKKAENVLDAEQLGAPLGSKATFVQFSSKVCAPCVATNKMLTGVCAKNAGVTHVEIDGEDRLDLVRSLGVSRTPTVFLLDALGDIRFRFVGPSKKLEILEALASLDEVPEPAAVTGRRHARQPQVIRGELAGNGVGGAEFEAA
jgi:thiol-disulfide isomerase/thioredoxin